MEEVFILKHTCKLLGGHTENQGLTTHKLVEKTRSLAKNDTIMHFNRDKQEGIAGERKAIAKYFQNLCKTEKDWKSVVKQMHFKEI